MNRDRLAHMLREAASHIATGDPQRAAWVIADAGGMLREHLVEQGVSDLTGLDSETGRGFRLPERAS